MRNDQGVCADRQEPGQWVRAPALTRSNTSAYSGASREIVKRASGEKFSVIDTIYPNVADGVDGMNFIQQCVASSKQNGAWLPLKHPSARK